MTLVIVVFGLFGTALITFMLGEAFSSDKRLNDEIQQIKDEMKDSKPYCVKEVNENEVQDNGAKRKRSKEES